MTETYSKSLSSDFGGDLKPEQLKEEIEAEPGIAPTCIVVFNVGDDVDITFDSALSGAEQTTLDGLVSSHSSAVTVGTIVENISVPDNIVDSTSYMTVASLDFPGTAVWNTVTNIKVISMMESDGTNYDIKIMNTSVMPPVQICTKNLTNTDEEISDLGTLSNLPVGESIFEVQARVDGTTIAHIKNINIVHD